MRKAARLFVLVMALMMALIGAAAPASAHVQQLDIRESATLLDDGSVLITGTITCTAGHIFQVKVQVQQTNGFRGSGLDRGTCTGDQQRWSVVAEDPNADAVEGQAVVQAIGRSFLGGNLHGDPVKRTEEIFVSS